MKLKTQGHPRHENEACKHPITGTDVDTGEVVLGAFMAEVQSELVLKGPRENVKVRE